MESYNSGLKSCEKYKKEVEKFKEYAVTVEKEETTDLVLQYLMKKSETYAPSSLWTYFSMLNNYFKIEKNIKLNDYPLIINFLKRKEAKHSPKKSSVLTTENVENFLEQANFNYLAEKAAMVIAVSGLMRISELVSLNFSDIVKEDNNYKVSIKQSKTDQSGKGFYFMITEPYSIHVKNYFDCFSSQSGRIFRRIENGIATNKVIGKNAIAKFPARIAQFLNLDDFENYTGHAFRRTGATILADKGSSTTTLKRAGRWSSSKVVDGYIDNGKKIKLKIASEISSSSEKSSECIKDVQKMQNITFNNCSSIVFHC